MLMRDRGQLEVSFGGVVGFKFESLKFVFEVMVPRPRWREVFEKFLVIEPFALHSLRPDSKKKS